MNNFLGSYSFLSMDTAQHNLSPSDLGEPVSNGVRPQPILFFAGEATDAFYGYANGAVASGFRAGDEILRHAG